jgi:hypothetical protein
MLTRLEQLADEIAPLYSKLILLVGAPGCGKTDLLRAFGGKSGIAVLNLGQELGRRLAALPQRERPFQAASLLRALAEPHRSGGLLLLDNLELLFDTSLALNPLDLLKRQAQGLRLVAAWPGDLRPGSQGPRLTYAELGHPEYRDYAAAGLVTLTLQI